MLSDALLVLIKHLRQGRLPYDSVTLRKDTVLPDDFYTDTYMQAKTGNLKEILEALQPKHPGYDSLRLGLVSFLDSIPTFRRYTYLTYPYKDSIAFFWIAAKAIIRRRLCPFCYGSIGYDCMESGNQRLPEKAKIESHWQDQ